MLMVAGAAMDDSRPAGFPWNYDRGEIIADGVKGLAFVREQSGCGFRKPQIRAYRWCSPPRIGCAIMSPNRSIGRVQGASLPSER